MGPVVAKCEIYRIQTSSTSTTINRCFGWVFFLFGWTCTVSLEKSHERQQVTLDVNVISKLLTLSYKCKSN